jgi:hypothetical protein
MPDFRGRRRVRETVDGVDDARLDRIAAHGEAGSQAGKQDAQPNETG